MVSIRFGTVKVAGALDSCSVPLAHNPEAIRADAKIDYRTW
jgi:hypothetical protein